jgi:cytochrome P450
MEMPAQSANRRDAPVEGFDDSPPGGAAIEEAIGRAIAFLRQVQLPHGEFKTLLGADMQISNAVFDSSPFVTSFVVYALSHVERARVEDMMQRALAFLRSEMEFGGLWRYYAARQFKHCRIPPDLDDTASVSYALRISGQQTPTNRWLFRYNRDNSGRFLTWVLIKKELTFTPRFWFTRLIGMVHARLACRRASLPAIASDPRLLTTRSDPVPADDVDPVVNANVILYLGEDSDTAAAVTYLIDLIRSGPGDSFSLYYKDILALHYMVARAHLHSSPALAAVKETVVADILGRQDPDGSFGNPLSTALAASALLTFAPLTQSLPNAICFLLRSQRADGSWEKRSFYSGPTEFWGSEELTTALCVEVLARYRRLTMAPSSPPVFDLVSPEIRQNPYPVYDELRRNWPVYYDAARKLWVISRYADLIQVLREPEAFSSCLASFNPTLHGADGPDHARVRRVVGRLFSARRVKRLGDLVRSLAHDLVERIAARGQCELIGDLAGPLPQTVVAWMLGIELGRLDDVRRWSAAIMHAGNDSLSDRERRAYFDQACECRTFLMHHLHQLAREPRGEHLAPFLTGIEDDDGLSVSEQVDISMFLMAAGAETTTLLIGNSMLVLLEDPAYQRRLRADARLIPAFIEEVLRYESPAQRTKRVTKRPADIAGIRLPQGAVVELLIGSANRDPDKFADADQFRIDRQPIGHISFGQGPHSCPGAQLARLEAAIVLETWVQRLPEVRRANPQEPVEFSRAISARGPARLDLVFPSRSDGGV